MRETLKRLFRMIVGYSAVQWAGPLLSLVFTPIITRLLTPSDYGVADYVLTIASAGGALALFGLPQALAAHFNDLAELDWQRRLVGSALALGCLIGLPIGLGLVLLAPWIAQSAFGDTHYSALFQMVGVGVAFGVCSAVLIAAAQAAMRVRWGMLLGLAGLLATVGGNVMFVIVLRLGAMGLVLSNLTMGVVGSIAALVTVRPLIGRPTLALVQKVGRSGLSLLPTVVAGWALMVADRLFLVHYVSTEALGHYAIANRIAGLAYVALSPMYTAWTSLALSFQHAPDARIRYANLARYLIAIVLTVSLGLGLFATEIVLLMTRPAYLPAARYVGLLTYVQVFTGFGTALYVSALAAKQLKAVSWTVGAGALVNLGLNFILIPSYGLWGATVATVVGFAMPQFLLYLVLQPRFPVPYPVGRLLGALGVHACLLGAGLLLPALLFPVRLALKLGLFALLPLAFVLLRVVTPFELQQARLAVVHRVQVAVGGARQHLLP